MDIAILIFLLVTTLVVSQVIVLVTLTKDIEKLNLRCSVIRTRINELEVSYRQLDVAIKRVSFSNRTQLPSPYRAVSGDMDLARNGQTATVRATFYPKIYS